MMDRVLIVDDDTFLADILAQMLGLQGYLVLIANGAREGVRIGLGNHPDVVIAAWRLRNDMSGGEVCRRIRIAWPNTKVIFMTGCDESVSQAEEYCERVATVLVKPFHKEEILGAVRQALGGGMVVPPPRSPVVSFQYMAIGTVS